MPAGKREINETAKECAIRELFEETGQIVPNLKFQVLAKIRNLNSQHIKYNPIFFSKVENLTASIPNEEMESITLWDLSGDIGPVDDVDIRILMALKHKFYRH